MQKFKAHKRLTLKDGTDVMRNRYCYMYLPNYIDREYNYLCHLSFADDVSLRCLLQANTNNLHNISKRNEKKM